VAWHERGERLAERLAAALQVRTEFPTVGGVRVFGSAVPHGGELRRQDGHERADTAWRAGRLTAVENQDTTDVTYYALLAAGRTRDNPAGMVRRTHTTPPTDEVFSRDLTWQPTAYLACCQLGYYDSEHVEITEQEANAILDGWRTRWPREDALNPKRRRPRSSRHPR
jgi:hypothetical protein